MSTRKALEAEVQKIGKPIEELTDDELSERITSTDNEVIELENGLEKGAPEGYWDRSQALNVKLLLLRLFTEEKHDRDYPNRLVICEGGRCTAKAYPTNELEIGLEKLCGVKPDVESIDGKDIELLGRKFRIECTECLGACFAGPRVDIVVDGNDEARAKVTSLESLREQIQQVIDGTWDYPGWPE